MGVVVLGGAEDEVEVVVAEMTVLEAAGVAPDVLLCPFFFFFEVAVTEAVCVEAADKDEDSIDADDPEGEAETEEKDPGRARGDNKAEECDADEI